MAANLGAYPRATPRASLFSNTRTSFITQSPPFLNRTRTIKITRIRVSNDGSNSYLDMWKTAVDRERKTVEFQQIAGNLAQTDNDSDDNDDDVTVDLEKKSEDFKKILEVSKEERDRIQRVQVIDRAAAAIAAARDIVKEKRSADKDFKSNESMGGEVEAQQGAGTESRSILVSRSESSADGVPGPDFWSWTPPLSSDGSSDDSSDVLKVRKSSDTHSTIPVAMKERSADFLSIPFESKLLDTNHSSPIPPLQSLVEVEGVEGSESILEMPSKNEEERELGVQFSAYAAEAAHALEKDKFDELSSYGVTADGSRCWRETGIEQRPDGVICRWTMTRGVSADQEVEWQEKFWEAADDFGYKELGSEKSGRDATGNVWREFWRESMRQESGLLHLEKTADKWGKNGEGDEWQEQWWEHYGASGQAEKWAHKWCSIDPTTNLEAGHAHVWHERWGEKYDGHGGSTKYTDKWAERCEGDGWAKWGDKWDENFDLNGHGVKQGEAWWEGKHGERWNRTWGERHNGSGWVHKYGKSSCGEHWDTHTQQDTWYERFPHYGFYHCFENSVQLREVQNPSERDEQ
ncbi:hypothetical protein POTOM_030238 [Populus tomentosa]|uniref:Uncharacterized protein n=1 Tax=Populus tomentosa TaxID=118781 RepID=A0A8X7ZAH3_POPTO|nr:hypothetical protein POTOM_030238 [Populus tomentosa]